MANPVRFCPRRCAIGAFDGLFVAAALALCSACASPPRAAAPEAGPPPADAVERARLPLSFSWRGEPRTLEALTPELERASGVCLGESHDDAHHHYAQRELVKALARQTGTRPMAVGFEMFQTPFQPALDRYVEDGNLGRLVAASEFEQRWGSTIHFYSPLLEAARNAGAALLALNAPRELSKAVARHGTEGLDPALAGQLPELQRDDREHRAFFERAMGRRFDERKGREQSPHGGVSMENLYQAQLVWDETMAQVGSEWLSKNPGGQLLLIAGSAHCQRSAVPRRIERRGPHPVIAARAVLRSELGRDPALPDTAFDLLLVLDDGVTVARAAAPPPSERSDHGQ